MRSTTPLEIRFAQPSDYDTLATIGAAACVDDPMDNFHHPKRRQYPDAYRGFYRRKVQYYADKPNAWIIVAVYASSPTDDGPDQIAGWAHWYREGSSSALNSKPNPDLPEKPSLPPLRRLSHWFESLPLSGYVHDVFNPATSLSAGHSDRSPSSEHLDPAHSSFRKPDLYWQLEKLVVAPEMQRRGIGAALCRWVMEQAGREGLMVLLEATEKGKGLYEKLGFQRYGTWQWGKEKYMFEIMMRWPPADQENPRRDSETPCRHDVERSS